MGNKVEIRQANIAEDEIEIKLRVKNLDIYLYVDIADNTINGFFKDIIDFNGQMIDLPEKKIKTINEEEVQ